MIKWLTICVTGAALCAAAGAKEGIVKKGDQGLIDVVKRECNSQLWVSEAMVWRNNKTIDPFRVNISVKVGDIIMLPDQCSSQKVPRETRQATMRWFKNQQILNHVTEVEKEKVVYQGQVADAKGQLAEAKQTADTLRAEKDGLVQALRLAKIATQRAEAREGKNVWRNAAIGFAIGAVTAFGGMLVFYIHRMRQIRQDAVALEEVNARYQEETREAKIQMAAAQSELRELQDRVAQMPIPRTGDADSSKPVIFLGKTYSFVPMQRFVACPVRGCSENHIADTTQNKLGHLAKHPHLHLERRPADECRRLIAASQLMLIQRRG
jgi:transcription elongation GreA/GreB family factor